MNLRPYQSAAVDGVFEQWKEHPSTLIEAATGTGKTRIASAVAERVYPKRTLFIAHRRELVKQAAADIYENTGLRCAIEMGELKSSEHFIDKTPVVVACVDTLSKGGDGAGRVGKFDPNLFGAVICDECHHSVAPTWMKIIKYFQTNPDLRVLGITATADRADEEALGQLFESVAYSYRIYDPAHIEPNAIDDGWLVFPRQKFVSVSGLDFSSIHTTAGDLNGSELARVMEREENIAGVVHPTLEWMFGLPEHTLDKMPVADWGTFLRNLNRKPKSTVGFAVSVAQAEMMSDIFNRVWPGLSAWICGKTDPDDRDQILRRFKCGEIPAIWNCNCLTEGWDAPDTEIMVDASPTKSRARYAQRVGRVTRPHSSIASKLNALETPAERKALIASSAKPEAVVLDFLGNSGKHKLICLGDILGGNVSEQVLERAIQRVKERGEGRFDEAIEEEEKRLREEAKAAEAARKAKLVFKAKFNSQDVDPFDILQLRPVAERGWDAGKQLSDKQRAILERAKIDPDSLPYSQAKQLVGELVFRLREGYCTLPQAKWLKNHGYSTNVSREEASRTMDAWAKNGWKRPQVQRTPPPPFKVPEPAGEPF